MNITQEELTRMRDVASRGQASLRDMRRVLDALDASEAKSALLSRWLGRGVCKKQKRTLFFWMGCVPM